MVGLVVATALAVGLSVYFALAASIVPQGLVRAEAHVGRLAFELEKGADTAREDIAGLVGAGSVKGLVAALRSQAGSADGIPADVWRSLVEELFAAEIAAKPYHLKLRLIDADGREVVRVEAGPPGESPRVVPQGALQDKSDLRFVKATLALPTGSVYVSRLDLNREGGVLQQPRTPVLRIAMPIDARDGTRWGLATLHLDMRPLFEQMRTSMPPNSSVYLVDDHGNFLIHPDPARTFGFEFDAPLRIADEEPALVKALGGLDNVSETGEAVSLGPDVIAAAAVTLAGATRLTVIESLPNFPRTALVAVRSTALLGAVLAALVAALVAVLLARHTARPILAMTRGVQMGGDTSALPVYSAGEVGVLARALVTYFERERWHGAILDNSNEAILTTTPDGTITGWNPSAVRLFRIPADAAVGLPVEAIIPPERASALRNMLRSVVVGDAVNDELEVVLKYADGGSADVRLRASPVRSVVGALMGASVVARDVTDERAAQESFRLAAEYSPAAKLLIDTRGQVVLVNAKLETMFGYKRDELLGRPFDVLVPTAARGTHKNLVTAFLRAPETRSMGPDRGLLGQRKDGSTFPMEVGLTPVPSRGGLLVLAAIIDISERKAAQRTLEERTRQLERSNADLTQFAQVASHDMQEPLRIIASFAQLLAERYRGSLDERADKYIDFIVGGAKRMQSLVNDILEFSRIGTEDEPHRTVDLAAVLAEVRERLASSIAESGAVIEVDGALPAVRGDASQLSRVLQNLLANAIKYRSERPPHIILSAERDDNMWRIAVADNGVGFDEKFRHKIFLMFQRLHVPNAPRGSGVGLAIAKRILEQHGGNIWAHGSPGEGATFIFTLPAAS